MKWNPAEYGNLLNISMPADKLWKPDVLLYNRLAFIYEKTNFYPRSYKLMIVLQLCVLARNIHSSDKKLCFQR